ncbi:MAG: YihY/virulence factor BrkB family protein [Verrucomicrobiae bacterium]|nr:YihY/virulence factor BrkB family protein [Verrucomicrobiae bacterium]
MKPLNIVKLWAARLTRAAEKWWRHKHADEAAALAFYSLISLVPILLVGISVASIFVDEETATRILLSEAGRVAGPTVGGYFAQILQNDIHWVGSGVSPIIGGLLLLFAATKVIAELRKSLGKVFGVPKEKGRKAAIAGLVGRLAAMIMLLLLGVFIASAVIFETMMGVIVSSLNDSPLLLRMATAVSPMLSFGAMVFLAAVAMRWLPARPPRFREALFGGAVSAVLLVGLKIGLAQFLQHTDVGSFYGSALTLVLVLFWVYFAMQAFLYGSELVAELMAERRMRESSIDQISKEGSEGDADAASAESGDSTLNPMSPMKDVLARVPLILSEAAICERLRGIGGVELHPTLFNAPLIYDPEASDIVKGIFTEYIAIAEEYQVPILIAAPTWRLDSERVAAAEVPPTINRDAVEFINQVKEQSGYAQVYVAGLMAPQNDCYQPSEALTVDAAERFHATQANELAETKLDALIAQTIPSVSEAEGMARAMLATGLPVIISFCINRHGQVLDGTPLDDAIDLLDSRLDGAPLGYFVNCSHPTFVPADTMNPRALRRLIGICANASSKDHSELEQLKETAQESLEEWTAAMAQLNQTYGVQVLGGCCGTDDRYLRAICEQVAGPADG